MQEHRKVGKKKQKEARHASAPTTVLTVKISLDNYPVMEIETMISEVMARAFISADNETLQPAIYDMLDQMEDVGINEKWRLVLYRRLKFALTCAFLSALTGQKQLRET